ncbi:hypothetical protein TcYC6_0079890 [Trypanosoma cruzi]|uniref:C3H1-type domain-containing protein n=1 Tax=Trypanosoma cruzi TaxID=5693 RepID=A0A7J6Y9T0_TRYCR|nr:hypothetical protein ECC02_003887 [Trypanosoma cruzi]KAF8297524.1 hypothetical protein TcYC6_0079890 [Trypanosoma cruzi]
MFGSEQFRQRFSVGGGGNPAGAATPFMMMYGVCPKTNGVASTYSNQPQVTTNNTAFQRPYGFHVNGYGATSTAPHEEEDTEGLFEVHDSHWKVPISVHSSVVSPSVGSRLLFSSQHPTVGPGNRSVVRVCENFQEGHCVLGENCNDIHLHPEYLMAKRQAMILWIHSKEREFQNTLIHDPRKVFRVFCADLKEVVEVPISALRFTKGLYVDPNLRARRARSGHQNQFAVMASQVPTACGLFSEDPSQCKWGKWCNQVHIEQGWMQFKKNEFESWSNGLERRFNELPPDHLFSVHDPQLKTTLSLPKASIAGFSRGLFQGSAKKAPSVCMLFQRSRCTANTCCNQIHVDQSYLQLHRRWVCNGEQLPEEKRRELWEQMNSVLESLLSRCDREAIATNDMYDPARELNPQAQPFVPSPLSTPQPTEKFVGETGAKRREKRKDDACHVKGEGKGINSFATRQSRSHVSDYPFSAETEIICTPMKSQGVVSTGTRSNQHHQQQQEGLNKNISANGTNCINSRSRNNNSAGAFLPLGEFVTVVDGDERSQSSLQASHSNISHAGRSYKHTNNPYTFGGSSSCAASPSFGWVQPIRSAGNSCTTMPNSCAGAETGGSNGGNGVWGMRTKADPSPAAPDNRSALFGAHHEFDNSFCALSPSFQWNASGSTPAKTIEELQKVSPDMDHTNAEENGFLETP